MTRRRALWLLAVAVLALSAVQYAYDRQMQDAGGHGILAFEVAFTHARAHAILTAWGHAGRHAARLSLWFDYLFLTAYGFFVFFAVRALRDALAGRGFVRLARPGAAAAALALVAAACDACENAFLLLQLGGRASALGPPLAGAFASVKFACLVVALVYLLVGLVALAVARRRVPAR